MKDLILQTLSDLRRYALAKGLEADFYYQEEQSALMRFANSAISLSTSEHLIRLEITAYLGRKRVSHSLITDLNKADEIRGGIDRAAEMVTHAQPLEYEPTLPVFKESFADESGFDGALAGISNAEKLAYFNRAVQGLESAELALSGIFSSGVNTIAQINTRSEHTQFFRTTDAQVSVVLAHPRLKWEVLAEQSAARKAELEPEALRQELAFLVERYQVEPAQQLPLGRYDILFGPYATADLLSLIGWIGYDGGWMKRGYSFLREDQVGKRIFSDQFSLIDDPSRPETFPFRRDFTGLPREPFPIIQQGVFQGFTWRQDDADEYAMQPTGHTVSRLSLAMAGGDRQVGSLAELVSQPRSQDLLYIPYLHYMNVPDPSHGVITSSSRFGALLLKKDGSIVMPFNVRLTQSLLEIFGEKVAWLSSQTFASNTSSSYGARNPTAVIVPLFMCVRELEISHSNASF